MPVRTDSLKGTYASRLISMMLWIFNMRVRSWLRINAGGVLNTCKSNGVVLPRIDGACT